MRKAILFGSYSKGSQNANSDIDIFVDSGLTGLRFFGLLEDITEALEREVDLIDASQVIPNPTIDEEIKKGGVLIYER